ncbi:Gfo/Idh/MocA family protein [Amycolatopsis samaneae]|uniref:Gfo/Idh/MocA family protein n=1 Tax=Amycolatopsis samaneae TaxID=664691 RepID=A0ABW5GP76_9PSEU
MRRLGLGVLGCASVAKRRLLPALREVPSVALVSIGSRDGDRAAAFTAAFGGRPIAGYQGVLDDPDVDAVYICLPNSLHSRWAARALHAGKHVLVEKPLATGLGQAEELVGIAAERGLHLVEAFAFLHHPQHRTVRELIAEGVIGTPRTFHCDFGIPPRTPGDIRLSADLAGGALLDLGVYTLRAATMLTGSELEVVGGYRRHDPVHEVDTSGCALLASCGGAAVQAEFGFGFGYRSAYSVWGTTGRLSLGRAFTPPPDRAPVIEVEDVDGPREILLPPSNQFALMAKSFAEDVLTGRDPLPARAAILRQAALVSAVREHAGHTARRLTETAGPFAIPFPGGAP